MNVREKQTSWPLSQKNKTKSACNSEEFAVNNEILKEVVKYQDTIPFAYLAVNAPPAPRPGFPLLISLSLPVSLEMIFS